MRSIENEGDLIDAEIRRIGFNLEAQFTAHLQHHRIFLKNLAGYCVRPSDFPYSMIICMRAHPNP